MVRAKTDPRGLNHVFTFFALPGPVTCFKGVQYLPPGHFLRIELGGAGQAARVSEHVYWQQDYPDWGHEGRGRTDETVNEFERRLLPSVTGRSRAELPAGPDPAGGRRSQAGWAR